MNKIMSVNTYPNPSKFYLFLSMLCLFFWGQYPKAAVAQASDYDQVVNKVLEEEKVPGLAVAIIEKGNVIYQKGFGMADVKKKTPVTASTGFMIGSVTKQFTAMATLILIMVTTKLRAMAGTMEEESRLVSIISKHIIIMFATNYGNLYSMEIISIKSEISIMELI